MRLSEVSQQQVITSNSGVDEFLIKRLDVNSMIQRITLELIQDEILNNIKKAPEPKAK